MEPKGTFIDVNEECLQTIGAVQKLVELTRKLTQELIKKQAEIEFLKAQNAQPRSP